MTHLSSELKRISINRVKALPLAGIKLKRMEGQVSEDPKQSTADMTVFVQNLLQQMQTRFQTMSDSIISKIDEMGNRIDELEQSINDLRTEMGHQEASPSPPLALKPKDETKDV